MAGITNTTMDTNGGYQAHVDPLCIRSRRSADLDHDTRDRIAALAADLRRTDPRIDDIAAFCVGVHKGCGPGPGIWFGDTAEIRLMAPKPGKRFDYRLGWLAGPDCVVVTGGPSCASFENYQRRIIEAPNLTYLNVDPEEAVPRRATPVRCLRNPDAYRLLLTEVIPRAGVTLHAHQTTGSIWALAARLYQDSGHKVHVAGPPPLLSRRTNDKIWFGDIVKRLLGTGATPPKLTAESGSALTRHVAKLVHKCDRLVVKTPDSAGSEGNRVVHAKDCKHLNLRELYEKLKAIFPDNGHGSKFPVLVEVWNTNVLTSPSVQTWIPLPEHGLPIIEGIFEQLLSGETAAFAGAVQADLPKQTTEALCNGAMQLSTLFQQLGYFGRCSFDALVAGANRHEGEVYWIECNARWGGVSIPMSLANRLAEPVFTVVQDDENPYPATTFADALVEFSDLAYIRNHQTGVIFLSPNLMEAGAGAHFLSFGFDAQSATDQANRVLRCLQHRG